MVNILILFALFLSIFSSESLFARTVELFHPNGEAVENYQQMVDSIKDGDSVRFSDVTEVTIDSFLGSGKQTAVFSLKDKPGLVIRIPRPSEFKTQEQVRDGLTSYAEGSQALEKFEIPKLRVYAGLRREYLIVKKLPKAALSLETFLKEGAKSIDRVKASKSLVKFMVKSAGFGLFGDFHQSQLMYDPTGDQWLVADWDNKHDPAFEIRDNKVVTRYLKSTMIDDALKEAATRPEMEWVRDLHLQIKDEVQKERLRILKNEPQLAKDYALLSKLSVFPSFSPHKSPVCSALFGSLVKLVTPHSP